ncbi:MAG TPA: adenine-specific methyltransferase EcoRI family protein [Atribacterota bacterium]|nr:adenine-specific methyltransferase EcoRI family protein [Atribacterota bacterium]
MANKSLNGNLHKANKAKNDEFYTQLVDIEKELKHYKQQFRGKVVYCNCDDPYESNFFKYFAANFNALELKKLITTSYIKSPIVGGQLALFDVEGLKPSGKEPFKIEIKEVYDTDKNGAINLDDVEYLLKHDKNTATPLRGNGDFRSDECIELLKQADIVVTNPPFSLFRKYVAQLVEYDKKFVIIGNTNALTYREIFKLIKDSKLRTGYTNFNVGMFFVVPDDWEHFHHVDGKGRKIARVSTSCWFTNMEVEKHKQDITLYKKYKSEEYPKYENYDAININKYTDIPCAYGGAMGVPITFVDKFNPDQFEIIGLGISNSGIEIGVKPYKAEHKKYRKEIQKRGAVDGDLYMITNGIVKVPYARILIRNKKVKKIV